MATITKIPAADVQIGDHVGHTKKAVADGQHYPVTKISDGATSRRLELEGAGNIRPRKTTTVWVMLESDDPRLGGPDATSTNGDHGDSADAEAAVKATRPAKAAESSDQALERIQQALADRGAKIDMVEADGDQAARAHEVIDGGKKAGLRGKALERYILEGKGARAQDDEARAKREAKSGRQAPRGPKAGSMTSAMLEVLKGRRNPMTAKEIWSEIQSRGLAPGLQGKTPDATIGAKLSTEAKKDDGLFVRKAPGQYLAR